MKIFFYIAVAELALLIFISLTFLVSSIWEKEKRASVFGGLQLAVPLVLLVCLVYLQTTRFFNTNGGAAILSGGVILIALAGWLTARRTSLNPRALEGAPGLITGDVKRFDERGTVFSRNRVLKPGSEQYRIFYEAHPELESIDSDRRKLGGVAGRPGFIDRPYEKPNLAASAALASLPLYLSDPDIIKPRADASFADRKIELGPEDATVRVKGLAKHLGAELVGITEINPLWTYSHRGEIFHDNWEDWGRELNLNHKYAIVFTQEMSFEIIQAAPHTPTSIESRVQYSKGAYIATQLAAFIANLGYPATANHLRHYDALMVPLAVDAGLGELGRFGYVITKQYGPRVRLAAVTTDLPLIADKPVDIGVEDFCKVCKKCAVCCPSQSIPMDEQAETNGTLRWKLNAETCFEYWGKVGTGCNICMRVCPWSHAGTFPHRLIKEMVARNMISRRLFTLMDDIFYGKRPKPKAPPAWAGFDH